MYRCITCKRNFISPILKKEPRGAEIYGVCPFCGGRAQEPEERCRCCGRELYLNDRAYEVNEELYCAKCVNEVII